MIAIFTVFTTRLTYVGVLDVGNQIAQARKRDAAAIVLADVDQENGHNIYRIIIYIYISRIPKRTNVASYVKKQQLNRGLVSVARSALHRNVHFQGCNFSLAATPTHFQCAVVSLGGYVAFDRANTVRW